MLNFYPIGNYILIIGHGARVGKYIFLRGGGPAHYARLRRNLAVTVTRGGAQHGALERVGQARMGARGHLARVQG